MAATWWQRFVYNFSISTMMKKMKTKKKRWKHKSQALVMKAFILKTKNNQATAFHLLGHVSCFAHTQEHMMMSFSFSSLCSKNDIIVCSWHMLELVNKFSEITAVSTLKDAHALVRNVISSGKGTENLVFLSSEKTCSRLPNTMELNIHVCWKYKTPSLLSTNS